MRFVNNFRSIITSIYYIINFKWCKRFYDEIFKNLQINISDEVLAEQYNDIMRNAYMGNKLNGIIPCMGIYEFLDKLKIDTLKESDGHM